MKRNLIRYWTPNHEMVDFYGRKVETNHYQEVNEFGLVLYERYINDCDVIAVIRIVK